MLLRDSLDLWGFGSSDISINVMNVSLTGATVTAVSFVLNLSLGFLRTMKNKSNVFPRPVLPCDCAIVVVVCIMWCLLLCEGNGSSRPAVCGPAVCSAGLLLPLQRN